MKEEGGRDFLKSSDFWLSARKTKNFKILHNFVPFKGERWGDFYTALAAQGGKSAASQQLSETAAQNPSEAATRQHSNSSTSAKKCNSQKCMAIVLWPLILPSSFLLPFLTFRQVAARGPL